MEQRQGRRFSEKQAQTIKFLLATTDLPIRDIAARMGCSSGAVAALNRKIKIRLYNNKRSSWTVSDDYKDLCKKVG